MEIKRRGNKLIRDDLGGLYSANGLIKITAADSYLFKKLFGSTNTLKIKIAT